MAVEGKPPPSTPGSPDMCLVGSGYALDKAYLVRFVNTITGRVVCSSYFNLSKPSMMSKSACGNVLGGAGSRLVRKRWASGQLNKDPETIKDPFEASMPAPKPKGEAAAAAKDADATAEDAAEEDDDEDDDDDEDEASPPASQAKPAQASQRPPAAKRGRK